MVDSTKLTLISSFDKEGKASLLRHLLENEVGLKVGVVAGNAIDDALVSIMAGSKQDIVELPNGCACCAAAGECLQGIRDLMELSQQRGALWDHIFVDLSGRAPRQAYDMLCNAASEPSTLAGAKLHTMVALVDASTFVEEFDKRNQLHERPDLSAVFGLGNRNRYVIDLMCEQIECSDVLVLNKAELVQSQREITLVKQVISALNAKAQVCTSENGQVEYINVIAMPEGDGVANEDPANRHTQSVEALEAVHPSTHDDGVTSDGHRRAGANSRPKPMMAHGTCVGTGTSHADDAWVTSFCYQRRVPFHPFRLKDAIRGLPVRLDKLALSKAVNRDQADYAVALDGRSPLCCLIRSKGFVWLSNSHTQMFYWTHAGKYFEIKHHATWWAAHPRSEWPTHEQETIEQGFEGEMGDRRQELIFIGVNMDVAALTKLLDDCLLTAAEMADYRKRATEKSGA